MITYLEASTDVHRSINRLRKTESHKDMEKAIIYKGEILITERRGNIIKQKIEKI